MADIRQELATKFTGTQLEQETKKAEKDVLDQLIRQKLLLQKANELGFSANIDVAGLRHDRAYPQREQDQGHG